MVARVWRQRENEESLLSGCEVSVWKEENVLEMDAVMVANSVEVLNAAELYPSLRLMW